MDLNFLPIGKCVGFHKQRAQLTHTVTFKVVLSNGSKRRTTLP